jgi:hypothetical protein
LSADLHVVGDDSQRVALCVKEKVVEDRERRSPRNHSTDVLQGFVQHSSVAGDLHGLFPLLSGRVAFRHFVSVLSEGIPLALGVDKDLSMFSEDI